MFHMAESSPARTGTGADGDDWATLYEALAFDELRARFDELSDLPPGSSVALAAVCMVLVPIPPKALEAWRKLDRSAREVHRQVAALVAASSTGRYPFAAPVDYNRHPDLAALNNSILIEQNERVLERAASWLSLLEWVLQQSAFARFALPIVEDSAGNGVTAGVSENCRVPDLVWVPLRDPEDTTRPWMDLLVAELVKILTDFNVPMPTKQGERRGEDDRANTFDLVEELLAIVLPDKERAGLSYDAIRLRHGRGLVRAQKLLEQVIVPDHLPGAKYRMLSVTEWATLCATGFAGAHAVTVPIGDSKPPPAGCIWVPRRARDALDDD